MMATTRMAANSKAWICRFGLALLLLKQASFGVNGAIILNELMLDPLDATQSDTTWIELHNTEGTTIALNGWRLFGCANCDFGNCNPYLNQFIVTSVSIGPFGYVTIGNNNDTATNGGVHIDILFPLPKYIPGSDFDNEHELGLFDTQGRLSDGIFWKSPLGYANPNHPVYDFTPGASLAKICPTSGTRDVMNWNASTALINPAMGTMGDKGTPGKANGLFCPTKAPITAPTTSPTKAPTKAPTNEPTKAPTKTPTKAPTKEPTKSPTNAPTAPIPKLTGLDLFDAHRNVKLATLINGTSVTIPNDMKKNPKLNIVATFDTESVPKVESVVFSFRGNPSFRTDKREPFALCGDNGNNDSNGNGISSCRCDVLGCGTHTVAATPYASSGGTGLAGTPLVVTFTVTGCSTSIRGGK